MKSIIGKLLFGYGVGFFFGYVVISVGLGSVCPALYKVATPIVCREEGQSLEVEQQHHSWRPGANMWTARIYRTGPGRGQKEDCTTSAKLVAGAIYGLIIFILLLPKLCRKTPPPVVEQAQGGEPATPAESTPSRSTDEKLAELKKLHESDLITTEDYEKKKAEILKSI